MKPYYSNYREYLTESQLIDANEDGDRIVSVAGYSSSVDLIVTLGWEHLETYAFSLEDAREMAFEILDKTGGISQEELVASYVRRKNE